MTKEVNWSDPNNHAEQHQVRYLDQATHAAFINPNMRVLYDEVKTETYADPFGGTVDVHKSVERELTIAERRNLRAHAIYSRRQGFLEAGGDKAMIDGIIDAGRDLEERAPMVQSFKVHII